MTIYSIFVLIGILSWFFGPSESREQRQARWDREKQQSQKRDAEFRTQCARNAHEASMRMTANVNSGLSVNPYTAFYNAR